MRLIDGNIGMTYKVLEINLPEKIKRRLQMLGMTDNTDISILNKKFSGAVIIKIRGTRFAIAKAFAQVIIVGGTSND